MIHQRCVCYLGNLQALVRFSASLTFPFLLFWFVVWFGFAWGLLFPLPPATLWSAVLYVNGALAITPCRRKDNCRGVFSLNFPNHQFVSKEKTHREWVKVGKEKEKETAKVLSWYVHRSSGQTKEITAWWRCNCSWTTRGMGEHRLEQRISAAYGLALALFGFFLLFIFSPTQNDIETHWTTH